MTTRGLSNATPAPDDSPTGPDSSLTSDLETFTSELIISDDVLHSIQKLPSTAAELRLPSAVDCLSVHELHSVLQTLNVPLTNVDLLKSGRGKDKHDRGGQTRSTMLNLLVTKFGDRWGALHEMLRQKRTAANAGRKQKSPHDATLSFDLAGMEVGFCPKESALNEALSSVCVSEKFPTRDRLIFLSDSEYESVKQFHAAIHPRGTEVPSHQSASETTALEYLIGTLKETTAALEMYYNLASTAKLYVDGIVKHHEERSRVLGDGKLLISQTEQEPSEDPGDPVKD
jgi:hypothetical protein